MANLLKIAAGILTALPLVWILLLFVALFAVPSETFLSDEPSAGRSFAEATILYGLPLLVLVVLAMTSYYMVLLFKSDETESRKVLWTMLLILWFPFAAPVFWYQQVWRKPTDSASAARRSGSGIGPSS
jgi:hypothetical protein